MTAERIHELNNARIRGFQAGRFGFPWTSCIYPHGTRLHDEWMIGYREAVNAPVPPYRLPSDRRAA